MKVLMINGSSRNNGCTRAALDIMAETFKEEGIETEIIFIGNQPIADCMNCKKCVTEHQCVWLYLCFTCLLCSSECKITCSIRQSLLFK